jgi:hypothetical protein
MVPMMHARMTSYPYDESVIARAIENRERIRVTFGYEVTTSPIQGGKAKVRSFHADAR